MSHLAGKDTTKGIEAALVLCGDELRDVEHQRSIGVAVANGSCIDVIQRPLIQVLYPVLLSLGRRGQMPDHHLQQSLQVTENEGRERIDISTSHRAWSEQQKSAPK